MLCYVGGGWQQPPSDLSSAAVAGITILILVFILAVSAATCFCVRRRHLPWAFSHRQFTGGRASDYVDLEPHVPTPPPYDAHMMPLPPPYSPDGTADKPPDYEVLLQRDGRCLYRPRTGDETATESENEYRV